MLSKLRQIDLRILALICVMLGGMGQGVVSPRLPELLHDSNHVAFDSGLSAALMYLGIFVSTFFYGKLADRGRVNWVLCSGLCAYALILTGFIWASTVYSIFALRFIEGLSLSAIYVSADFILGRLSPQAVRGQWLSFYGIALSIGLGLGPVLNLLTAESATPTVSLLAVAGFVFLMGLLLFSRTIEASPEAQNTPPLFSLPALLSGACYGFIEAGLVAVFPVIALTEFHFSPEKGLIIVIISAALFSLLWGELSTRIRNQTIVLFLFAILSLGCAALLIHTQIILSCILFGAVAGGLYPIGFAWLLEGLPESAFGKASGSFSRAYGLGSLAGPLTLGYLTQKMNAKGLYVGLSGIGLFAFVAILFALLWKRHKKNLKHSLGIFLLFPLFALTAHADSISEIEAQIIQAFAKRDLITIQTLAERVNAETLPPLIRAVIAYSETDDYPSEKEFAAAEALDPTNAMILFLHAKYRFKDDPITSEPIWERLLSLNPPFNISVMAEDYLNQARLEKASDIAHWNFIGSVQTGFRHEEAPMDLRQDAMQLHASNGWDLSLSSETLHAYSLGSYGFKYTVDSNRYLSDLNADLLAQRLELPVVLQAGKREDVVFKPFTSYSIWGTNPYQFTYGVAIQGIAYHRSIVQSVQGSVFDELLFPSAIRAQAGTHFRFDYNWEFFADAYSLHLNTLIEHVQTDRDTFGTARIDYSHNNMGINGDFTYRLNPTVQLGISPKAMVSIDDNEDRYPSVSNGQQVIKRGDDYLLGLEFHLVVPLNRASQIFAWYEWDRNFSNFGPDDFMNRNFQNLTLGIGIKAIATNF